MKRSEMVKQMAEYWLGLLPGESPEEIGAELFAEVETHMGQLLKFMEHKGMKPPEDKEKSFQIQESGQMSYAVHEWAEEESDETK